VGGSGNASLLIQGFSQGRIIPVFNGFLQQVGEIMNPLKDTDWVYMFRTADFLGKRR
jgi:hypothetical protein